MTVKLETIRNTTTIKGFVVDVTVPEQLLQIIRDAENSSSDFFKNGYHNVHVKLQLDFRTQRRNWHYNEDWDTHDFIKDENFSIYIPIDMKKATASTTFYRDVYFEHFFPSMIMPHSSTFFGTNIWLFRSRFIVQYNSKSEELFYISPWSDLVRYDHSNEEIPSEEVSQSFVQMWARSSEWAYDLLRNAQILKLIPSILYDADMTKPITREEFAELVVLLYETKTGKIIEPDALNPFVDTDNRAILKAYTLGITSGVSPNTFEPKRLISREQSAVMLFESLRAINPEYDFSLTEAMSFTDQMQISPWALNAAKYLSKIGVITGNQLGAFMPRPLTQDHNQSYYGLATREHAIAMVMNWINNN